MKFGILLDSTYVEQWQYNTISHLVANGIELKAVIMNAENNPKPTLIEKIKHYPYSRMFFQVWNHYFFKPDCKKRVDISDLITSVSRFNCEPVRKGISNYFKADDVEAITNCNLDFILRFGFDIIRGDILNAARYGIWSFHHDDERIVRGSPPGFWEFMRNLPTNGIILQRLTNELDKGLILRRMNLKTVLHSYKEHLNTLYNAGTILPLQVCRDIATSGNCNPELSHSQAPILKPPRNSVMLKFLWLSFERRLAFHINDLFRQEDWNVAYCNMALKDFVSQEKVDNATIHYFKKPHKSHYFADPFVISTNNETYIFFEWYQYRKGKAALALALQSENFEKYHILFEDEYHHAFPFVFELDGDIFCMPESAQADQLRLYRFNTETLQLEFDSVLLDHCSAIDSVLLKQQDKWYLLFTQKSFPSVMLYVYYAENFRGPYKAHFNNPVKVDAANARSAGKIFEMNGKLLRPAQECCKEYGTAVIINDLCSISPTSFNEKVLKRISLNSLQKNIKGFHTLNGNENITVFDVKCFTFTLWGFRQQLRQKISHRKNSKK